MHANKSHDIKQKAPDAGEHRFASSTILRQVHACLCLAHRPLDQRSAALANPSLRREASSAVDMPSLAAWDVLGVLQLLSYIAKLPLAAWALFYVKSYW